MNYKNCKHYNEVVRVLDNNLSLEDVNFEIDDTDGCKCKSDEDSVCDLWVALALAHDFTPTIGLQTAEKTLAGLDAKITAIATGLLHQSIDPICIDEPESIDEPVINTELYESLIPEHKKIIEQLLEMDNTTNNDDYLPYDKRTYKENSNKELIEEAICQMDTESLKKLLSDKYKYIDHFSKNNFVAILDEEIFAEFKNNGDTFLTPYKGNCQGSCCDDIKYKGIAFVGNNSKDVVKLIFEENDFEYVNIFSCSNFKIFQNIKTNKTHHMIGFNLEDLDEFDVPF